MHSMPLLKPLRYAIAALVLVSIQTSLSQAYTVVTASTSATPGIESAFIAATTTQFTATLIINPYFPNTYQLLLFSRNPGYNAPIDNQQLLDALTTVDSNTYVYGWAQGQVSMQNQEIVSLTNDSIACSTDTVCEEAFTKAVDDIYNLQLSTPQPVPGF